MLDRIKQHLWLVYGVGLEIALFAIALISRERNNIISGICISLILLTTYYFFVCNVIKRCGLLQLIKDMKINQMMFILGLLFVTNIFLLSVLLKDRYLYFWDFGGYWGVAIEQSSNMFATPFQTMRDLYMSINNDEYNKLIPCLIALPLRLLGKDFEMYGLIIYNMFVVPTFVSIYLAIMNILKDGACKASVAIFFVICSCATFYSPILLGYLDAFALLNLSLAFLVLSSDFWKEYSFGKSVLLGISLILSMLGRRYFAFAVVGIVVAVVLASIYKLIISKNKKEVLLMLLKTAVTVGITMATPMLMFFRKFLKNSADGTIKEAYSAYQSGTMVSNYIFLVKYFGLVSIVLALLGVILWIKNKKNVEYLIVIIVSFFVTTFLFYRVQSMGNHHYYLTVVPISILMGLAITILYGHRNKSIYILTVVLTLSNLAVSVTNMTPPQTISCLWTNQKLRPQIRGDIPEIQAMASDLKALSNEGHVSYVLASSTIINDDIIRKVYMPDELVSVPNLCVSNHVDLRDGFPTAFLTADIVLVANPVQYHLSEDSQRVVCLLAEEFTENKELAKNFVELKNYTLDDGVTVTMYQKVSEYTEEQKQYLRDLFNQYYSDYPELFNDRIN